MPATYADVANRRFGRAGSNGNHYQTFHQRQPSPAELELEHLRRENEMLRKQEALRAAQQDDLHVLYWSPSRPYMIGWAHRMHYRHSRTCSRVCLE